MSVFEFRMLPQPSINKNFSLLISELKKLQQQQFSIFLFSDNVNQFKRLEDIFHDLQANVIYQPVAFALREGFMDEERKIACFTDHQLFQRFHRYRLRTVIQKVKRWAFACCANCSPAIL